MNGQPARYAWQARTALPLVSDAAKVAPEPATTDTDPQRKASMPILPTTVSAISSAITSAVSSHQALGVSDLDSPASSDTASDALGGASGSASTTAKTKGKAAFLQALHSAKRGMGAQGQQRAAGGSPSDGTKGELRIQGEALDADAKRASTAGDPAGFSSSFLMNLPSAQMAPTVQTVQTTPTIPLEQLQPQSPVLPEGRATAVEEASTGLSQQRFDAVSNAQTDSLRALWGSPTSVRAAESHEPDTHASVDGGAPSANSEASAVPSELLAQLLPTPASGALPDDLAHLSAEVHKALEAAWAPNGRAPAQRTAAPPSAATVAHTTPVGGMPTRPITAAGGADSEHPWDARFQSPSAWGTPLTPAPLDDATPQDSTSASVASPFASVLVSPATASVAQSPEAATPAPGLLAQLHGAALNPSSAATSALAHSGDTGGTESDAPTARIATPLHDPEFGKALGVQLTDWATDGIENAWLEVHPADLGPVSIQIAVHGHQAQLDFGAPTAEARSVIEASLPELAAALQAAGLTLSGGGVHEQLDRRPSAPSDEESGARSAIAGVRGGRSIAGSDTSAVAATATVPKSRGDGLVDLYA